MLLLVWIVKIAWSFVRGRWFYFREAPNIIVFLFSRLDKEHEVVSQARQEWRLRKRSKAITMNKQNWKHINNEAKP
jgi:hypothetical protein